MYASKVIIIATMLATVTSADASPYLRHKVKTGETASLLAAENYGNRRFAPIIFAANGLLYTKPQKLTPGKKIKIPQLRYAVVSPGDTMASLAKKHLGKANRAILLAEYNGISADDSLVAGTVLTVPPVFDFKAPKELEVDSVLKALRAGKASARDKLARKVLGFNALRSSTVPQGKTIAVPALWVRSKVKPKLSKDQRKVVSEAKRLQSSSGAALIDARKAWQVGNYADIIKRVSKLWEGRAYFPASTAQALGVLLGASYIATGDDKQATTVFRALRALVPKFTLDPYHHSPKIRAVFEQAVPKQ